MDQDYSSLGKGLESLIPPTQKKRDEPAATPPFNAVSPAPFDPRPTVPTAAAFPTTQPAEREVWAKEAGRKEREKLQSARFGKLTASKMPDAIFHIEVDKIKPNPDQPRRNFDEVALRELAASIREFGLLQPIVVTKVEREVPTGTEVEYVLISGERRLQAAKLLGMELIPAIIRNVNMNQERLEMAIIENIQREDLNPIEMARAMSRLQDEFRLTQREIAARLGKSREVVANTLRLLDLPADVRQAIEENKISESHGRLLLTVEDQQLQQKLFRDLVEHGLTTRELQNRVRTVRVRSAPERTRTSLPPELQILQEKLSMQLGTPVAINQHGDSGKITISFYSEEELKSIVEKLGGEE